MTNPVDLKFVTNEAFREIFHSMSEGIIMVDPSGHIAVANPVAEQMFGYQRDMMSGLVLEQLLPERYRGSHVHFRKHFNDAPHPRRMGFGRDLMAVKQNGEEFPVEISLSYTKVKGVIMVMAFISDITLRKRTEDALKQSEEQLIVYAAELEKKVEMRTQALHNTVARLEEEVVERKKAEEEARKSLEKERELNELKSKFVSLASHEFRTPLSTIMSSASLVRQYNERGEADKIQKHVQRIKSSVNHLTSILNDFLNLGKLEEGKIDVKKESIVLKDFMQETREDVVAMLKEGQQLNIECDLPATHTIFTDPRILRNILYNLISNAIKYSDPGKVISIICEDSSTHLFFSVKDQGIGIPEDDQRHLFDRFFRASNAGNIPGTGLGLNIVKRYIELLKGSIEFTSEYEKGTTFRVMIPLEGEF